MTPRTQTVHPTSLSSDDSRRAVLLAVRRGDPAALGQVYAAHADVVYRVALRLLADPDAAEDVLQDVFVGLPHALRAYEEQGSFEAWLKRVTVRTALMKRRSEDRRRQDALDDAALVPERQGAIDPTDRLAIRAAIEALPRELRVVFVLKEVEGYSHAEVGQFLGITSGASAARLFRAWQALHQRTQA